MTKKTIIEKIDRLQPGEAIHMGHSYLVINVAGIKIALDPSTETGFCTAPFCNLLPQSISKINSLRPVINPSEILPRAEALASHVDVVLYSHLHSDHFAASMLNKMVNEKSDLRVIWPYGSSAYLSSSPPKPGLLFTGLMNMLHKLKFFNDHIDGIFEYLAANQVFDPKKVNYVEMQNGTKYTLRENPLVEIHAFEVQHPRPQVYVKLPCEPSNIPAVLGYQIEYDEDGKRKKLLLVGETGTDPELLWKIWKNRDELVGIFIPVADESSAKGLKLIKDIYMHASLRIIPLSERLSGDKTNIYCLHQGLWYYTLDNDRVKNARKSFEGCHDVKTEEEIEAKLRTSRQTRNSLFPKIRNLIKLIKAISCFNVTCENKVRLNLPGIVFAYDNRGGN